MRSRLMQWTFVFSVASFFLNACTVSRPSDAIDGKIAPAKLKSDYTLFRGMLEEQHPGLYWFTPKDSMDAHFNEVYSKLEDSLTEQEFRNLLNFTTSRIHCGHTAAFPSKRYMRQIAERSLKTFPLSLKCWKDTAVVIATLSPQIQNIRQGTVLLSIDGKSVPDLLDTMLLHINGDGYAMQGKYQFLSNRGTFGAVYRNLFGLRDSLDLEYIDTLGDRQFIRYPVFVRAKDEERAKDSMRREERERVQVSFDRDKTIYVDTVQRTAYMSVNTFSRNSGLTRYYRRSFKNLRKHNIKHLIIDVRTNGGGDAGLSTLLTRYIADHPFKIADSLYCIKRSSKYRDYIPMQPLYWLFTSVVTKKKDDGNFHFGIFERHVFKPKKRNHFKGKVYILTGGNSFSATTLFAQELKGQSNVTIVGEETGGGAYGNNAWIIPMITLPHTRLRFRLPRFRLVIEPSLIQSGRGVMPDVYASPTVEDIKQGNDVKMNAVRKLIARDLLQTD